MSDKNEQKKIKGFSKLAKRGKIKWIVENFFKDPENVMRELISYWHTNEDSQKILDEISENTISNFHLPFGVAPNFIIDGKTYAIPMVIEESSVVAAASSSAKFWMDRGGFVTKIISTVKVGQVHFTCKGDIKILDDLFDELIQKLRYDTRDITANMERRGGGILGFKLIDLSDKEPDYYQLRVEFETCDSMGANFINSNLEKIGISLSEFVNSHEKTREKLSEFEVIMAILSNYTPECLVEAKVSCPISDLGLFPSGVNSQEFATRFYKAIRIALVDPYRAVTHNKGIFNGIDAVVLSTGNDFRAIEACGHAYASRDGQYRSLSNCSIDDGVFTFWLRIPLAIGTVGGLTNLHPIAKRSLELLGKPSAQELMSIIASVGLAQNFSALRSLVTTGIQKGHMKMHLMNILRQLDASEEEAKDAVSYFKDHHISFSSVREYLDSLRVKQSAL